MRIRSHSPHAKQACRVRFAIFLSPCEFFSTLAMFILASFVLYTHSRSLIVCSTFLQLGRRRQDRQVPLLAALVRRQRARRRARRCDGRYDCVLSCVFSSDAVLPLVFQYCMCTCASIWTSMFVFCECMLTGCAFCEFDCGVATICVFHARMLHSFTQRLHLLYPYFVSVCVCLNFFAGTAPDGSPCKIMTPVRGDALNEKFFVAQKWEDWDKESWQELVGRSAAVLLSDGMQSRFLSAGCVIFCFRLYSLFVLDFGLKLHWYSERLSLFVCISVINTRRPQVHTQPAVIRRQNCQLARIPGMRASNNKATHSASYILVVTQFLSNT
jgi:hypothetical protein